MIHRLHVFLLTSLCLLMGLSARVYAEQAGEFSLQGNHPSDWSYSVGGGVMYGPAYEGSNKYVAIPIPVVSVEYKEGLFFVDSQEGIGTYPIQGENYELGASMGLSWGRKESGDRKNLRGMGDIDIGVTANLMGEYILGPVQLSGVISNGNEGYGTTAKLELGTMLPATKQLVLIGSIGMTWADKTHMNTYFGVSSKQCLRSGYRQYGATSGIKSVGFSVGAFYFISENWEAQFIIMGDQLRGDASNSPLTKRKFSTSTILTLSYKF